ncbi:ribonucleoside-diphosphate reductase subunit alpha [bacterium]|nr:ribonucleoside-diphosphate reductase subunit alpha [bacterium]
MAIEKITKRSGEVVDFDQNKIELAIHKAAQATSTEMSHDAIGEITRQVVTVIEDSHGEATPSVEHVQDIVERTIAASGSFDVAKAYILYRYQQLERREEEQAEIVAKAKTHQLNVVLRDGTKVPFDVNEITAFLVKCIGEHSAQIDTDAVVQDAIGNVYDGITTGEINQAVVMALKGRIEHDPAYSTVAARVLLNDLYREVLGTNEFSSDFADSYQKGLIASITKGVTEDRLDKRMLEYDLSRLAKAIDASRDQLFGYLGAQVLYDRYFQKDLEQNIFETPQYFWMRVAMGLALGEDNREERALEFYETMSTLHYVPSTPTLFHAGTTHPQMSSCYLTTVEDDLSAIFKSFGDNAQLSKWSGGLGNDWTNIRATGSLIKSTNVGSQGVIPFLKIADATTAAINRSGKRRGATCVYLETWHYDIEDFLELRKNTGDDRRRTHDMNTANWIPDLFMKRVIEDGDWTLFSPDETPDLHDSYGRDFERKYEQYERQAAAGEINLYKTIKAKHLWRKMITMLFETGHPWITFKDPSNIRSPQDHVGVVHSSNLCTEITLNTSADETAVCNLGSVNIVRHITNGQLDKEKVARTVRSAMRMLDNVIDLNFYPTEDAKRSNLRHRPVGLGIMGLQDALYEMNLSFDTEEAVEFSDNFQELVAYHAQLSSSQLARERGAYESFKGSKWDRGLLPIDTLKLMEEERGLSTGVPHTSSLDWEEVRTHIREHGMRNSNTLAIAPTATIANISGVFPSIEPIYKNVYVKSNFSGEFTMNNTFLVRELKSRGLWNHEMMENLKRDDGSIQQIAEIPDDMKPRYKEVFEIDPIWIVKHAARRNKWIDQSQSVNIFVSTTSGKMLSDVYQAAWKMGLKTTYYLRSLGASAIEKSSLDITKQTDQPATEVAVEPVSAVATSVSPEAIPMPVPVASPSVPVASAPATVTSEVPRVSSAATNPVPVPPPAPVITTPTPAATAPPRVKKIFVAPEALCEACE